MAALVAHMPQGESALYAAIDPDAAWTRGQVLLAWLVNDLNGLLWGMSDPKTRGPAPQPIGPSWMKRKPTHSVEVRAMGVDELMRELSKPRR